MKTLKFICIFAVLACVSTEYVSKNKNPKLELSYQAKQQLKQALNVFVDNLCFTENVHPQLKNGVCKRIASYPYKKSAAYNNVHKRSRCSTCDAYVDPMCILDCPQ